MNYKSLLTASLLIVSNFIGAGEISQISTTDAPLAIGPYSQGVVAGDFIYVSGQIGVDPTTGKFAGSTIEEQTKQVLQNIEAILAVKGLSLKDVVKTEVFLTDLKDFKAMNAIYAEKFSHDVKAARATVQVSKLPLEAIVEISCVAYISQ